jgi:hypothetical protein
MDLLIESDYFMVNVYGTEDVHKHKPQQSYARIAHPCLWCSPFPHSSSGMMAATTQTEAFSGRKTP